MEYDLATKAVTKKIVDVNTGDTSDFSNLPSGWTNTSGLELITTYVVDGLGRTTKETSPNLNSTYYFYDDVDHTGDTLLSDRSANEVRVYPSWNGGTTTGPVVIYRTDYNSNFLHGEVNYSASYKETLTMTPSTIDTDDGLPTGKDEIENVQSDTRDYWNNAGQVVREEKYFNTSSWSSDGTDGTIAVDPESDTFYRTQYDYDDRGQLKRVESPTGTITRYVRDTLNRITSVWVGTDDTPTSSYWSPTNNSGANMGVIAEYTYDNGGVGDGNLTKTVQHVLNFDSLGASDATDHVTRMYYDWRDRRVGTKAGSGGTQVDELNIGGTIETGDKFIITVSDTTGASHPSSFPRHRQVYQR